MMGVEVGNSEKKFFSNRGWEDTRQSKGNRSDIIESHDRHVFRGSSACLACKKQWVQFLAPHTYGNNGI